MNIVLLFFSKSLASTMGWIGTFAYLTAYFLLSINKLKAEKKLYHILNVVGGIGLTCNALFLNDYPNVIVNVVWADLTGKQSSFYKVAIETPDNWLNRWVVVP